MTNKFYNQKLKGLSGALREIGTEISELEDAIKNPEAQIDEEQDVKSMLKVLEDARKKLTPIITGLNAGNLPE